MIRLSRQYRFPASHRLFRREWTEARNREVYGKCANPFGHGHDYRIEVTVSGIVNAITGRAVDLAALDHLLESEVLSSLRYRNLNEEVEAFREVVPTTENLAIEVDRRLRSAWAERFGDGDAAPVLQKVRIWETDRNICEIAER